MISQEIDALLAKDSGKTYHRCPVGHAIDQFEGDDREAIIRLIDSNLISTKVVGFLASKSFSITPVALTKHRRRVTGTGCSCAVTL